MAEKREITGLDIVNWQEAQPEGFRGIVTYPDGREGFYSKIGGAFSFFPIGEGQDPMEVEKAAHELHNALNADPDLVDTDYLVALGDRTRELAQPKIK